MSLHRDLLEQAEHLARKEPKKPKQASLRRALSTGYYALFHMLTSASSQLLSNSKMPEGVKPAIQRAFTHTEMKKVCKGFSNSSPSEMVKELLPTTISRGLRTVATTFVDLQTQRHLADYDANKFFDRMSVLTHLENVRMAIDTWEVEKNTPNAAVFLVALLVNKQWEAR